MAPQAVAFADAQQIQHLNEALAARYLIGQVNDILVEQFWTTVQ